MSHLQNCSLKIVKIKKKNVRKFLEKLKKKKTGGGGRGVRVAVNEELKFL